MNAHFLIAPVEPNCVGAARARDYALDMAWSAADIGEQTGRVAIVTGANSGIGFETARALASKGAQVVLACRSEKRGTEAVERIRRSQSDARVSFEALDLSRLDSVRDFAERFSNQSKRLDLLVNNAGVMAVPYTETEDGLEMQIGVNHFGHFALTARLYGTLRTTPGARIVNVSSLVHTVGRLRPASFTSANGYNKWTAYAQSKLANLLFTYEAAHRIDKAGDDVLSVASHPGYSATDLQRHDRAVRFVTGLTAQDAADGALPSLYAAVAPGVRSGDYFGPAGLMEMRGPPKRVKSVKRARDERLRAELWTESERLTGLGFLSS